MSSIKVKGERLKVKGLFILLSIFIFQFSLSSCDPDAKWSTKEVDIDMSVNVVSAGYVECSFATNKEAYYLIAIQEADEGYDPMAHQKQFMTLALDSANVEYLSWRHDQLVKGEFNVAPFASHSLQYGSVTHFFTGLLPGSDYWIYAFVVNPETLQPVGKLYLQKVTTTMESIMDIHFEYRVKGMWDYIYPIDSKNKIYGSFPYIATTCDSLKMVDEDYGTDSAAVAYFVFWALERFLDPSKADVYYGVRSVENDGYQSAEAFEQGHTYYTAICGYDGSYKQATVYKFTWTGESCNLYFVDTDSTNLVNLFRDKE